MQIHLGHSALKACNILFVYFTVVNATRLGMLRHSAALCIHTCWELALVVAKIASAHPFLCFRISGWLTARMLVV